MNVALISLLVLGYPFLHLGCYSLDNITLTLMGVDGVKIFDKDEQATKQ